MSVFCSEFIAKKLVMIFEILKIMTEKENVMNARKEVMALRQAAKAQIKGKIWWLLLAEIIIGLIGAAVGLIPYAGALIFVIFLMPIFEFSLTKMYMGFKNGNEFKMGDLFSGFHQYGSALLTAILMDIFLVLWTCLGVIPGIVKIFSYSMTWYVLADNPQMSATEAITESRRLMDGHKFDLLVLYISFIPWLLLCCVTFGIAEIYVLPYMTAAETNFYYAIKEEKSVNVEAA